MEHNFLSFQGDEFNFSNKLLDTPNPSILFGKRYSTNVERDAAKNEFVVYGADPEASVFASPPFVMKRGRNHKASNPLKSQSPYLTNEVTLKPKGDRVTELIASVESEDQRSINMDAKNQDSMTAFDIGDSPGEDVSVTIT